MRWKFLTTSLVVLVGLAVAWALPYGSHSVAQRWKEEAPAALATFGPPTTHRGGWDLRAESQQTYAVEASDQLPDQVGNLSVSVLEYENPTQAEFWSRVQDPQWNGIAWNDQSDRHRLGTEGLGLPPGARLYGLQCNDEGASCGRYFVWLRGGSYLIIIDVSIAGVAEDARQGLQGLDALWAVGDTSS